MNEQTYMPAQLLEVVRLHGLDRLEEAFSFQEAKDLTRPGLGHRSYFRLELNDSQGRPHVLYMKRYNREPLLWRLRRLLTYGWGKSPAHVEMENVRGADQARLPGISHAYANEQRDFLGSRRSYILLSEVPGVALEHCAEAFLRQYLDRPEMVQKLTQRLWELVSSLHKSGYVHRDLYNSHIYLIQNGDELYLHLIDLARMFRPRLRVFRWRVKDLAQLKYSMPPEWTRKYWDTFLQGYVESLGDGDLRRYARAVSSKERLMRRRLNPESVDKGSV